MDIQFEERRPSPCRCPGCGATLGPHLLLPSVSVPCPDCGYTVWCCSRRVEEVLVLDVLPDRTPEQGDIEGLADSLAGSCDVPRIIVELSQLDRINSLLLAKLIVLNRCIQRARGKLVLCGLQEFVRETFVSTKLDTLFEIVEDEETALDGFLSANPA